MKIQKQSSRKPLRTNQTHVTMETEVVAMAVINIVRFDVVLFQSQTVQL